MCNRYRMHSAAQVPTSSACPHPSRHRVLTSGVPCLRAGGHLLHSESSQTRGWRRCVRGVRPVHHAEGSRGTSETVGASGLRGGARAAPGALDYNSNLLSAIAGTSGSAA